MRFAALLLAALMLAGCGPKPDAVEDYGTRMVTLPGGQQVRAEVLINPQDLAREFGASASMVPSAPTSLRAGWAQTSF